MSEYFLGVDGGQSGTTVVIGDETGNVVGWASAGPCNHVSGSEARRRFVNTIGDCVTQASARAGIDARFKAACCGMSGGPDDKFALLHDLIKADHIVITNDARVALAGAASGKPGIIVIAGTGSIAFGENARGETARAGGWGYIYGDEGSAFDIARQALRAILREHEGWGPKTALTPALLEPTGAADANQLLHVFYTPDWPRSRVAGLAQTVDRLAAEGDPVAIEILNHAARRLAFLAGTVRRQLWSDEENLVVSWSGGVFNSEIAREHFQTLIAMDLHITCVPPQHGPAIGALLLSWRVVHLNPSPGYATLSLNPQGSLP